MIYDKAEHFKYLSGTLSSLLQIISYCPLAIMALESLGWSYQCLILRLLIRSLSYLSIFPVHFQIVFTDIAVFTLCVVKSILYFPLWVFPVLLNGEHFLYSEI